MTSSNPPASSFVVSLISPAILLCVSLAFFSINLDYPPKFDELYHVLGARGYIEFGEPRIAEGIYSRVSLFTAMIAALFTSFGESMVIARMPSVICGALLVATMFIWTRSIAGPIAAWSASVLFMLSPLAVEVFQYLRFYAPQALMFWLGALAIFTACTRLRPLAIDGQTAVTKEGVLRQSWLWLIALICFAVATYLQVVTLIGLLGVAIWAMLFLGVPWLRSLPSRTRWMVILIGGSVCLIGFVIVWGFIGSTLLATYLKAPLYAAPRRHVVWFYHFWLNLYYPSIWPIFPFLVLGAVCLRSRPALFCLAIFGTAMLLHAFAASKARIYIFYAMPFMFVLFGMGLAYFGPPVVKFLRELVRNALTMAGLPATRRYRYGVWILAGLFLLGANTATIRTITMLAGVTVPPEVHPSDWAAVAPTLRPIMAESDVVVTANELHTLYFIGEYDILLGASRMSELREKYEFEPDHRTGRPVISQLESVDDVVDCFASGVFIIEKPRWRNVSFVSREISNLIVTRTEEIELPATSRIRAFSWARDDVIANDQCEMITSSIQKG